MFEGDRRFAGTVDGDGLGELLSPQRHGIDEGGVDFVDEAFVVFLHHADARQGLHRDLFGQAQVVQAAVKFVALHLPVAQALRAFHFTVFGGFGERGQDFGVGRGQHVFSGGDVVFEFAVVVEVGVVEFV